jgi:pimeloyl-ACP methyl ester carboxylesterase
MAAAAGAAAILVAASTIGSVMSAQSAPQVTHEYATVNGVRLHYVRAGTGPLIMFLHGFPEFWYEWKHQIPEFSRDRTVVAPDMRGYDLSDKPADVGAYSLALLVEDVRSLAAQLLKDTPNRKFTLVAHDWGGMVAWAFAAQHPEMLDHLVIVNAPHPTVLNRELRTNPAQQQASQYMLRFRAAGAEAALAANNYAGLVATVLGESLKSGTMSEEDKAAYLAAWSQPGALTGGLNYYRASEAGPAQSGGAVKDLLPDPVMIRVPTLVIWAEKDTYLLTGNLDGLDAFVPDLTVRRIPDATHWLVHEKPAEVNRIIREYLDRR